MMVSRRLVLSALAALPLAASFAPRLAFADDASDLPVALRLATLQVVASLYDARLGQAPMSETARALVRPFAPARL